MAKKSKTMINLPPDLKTEARIKAIREGKNLSEVVAELLTAYVKGDGQEPSKEPEK